MIQEHKLTLMQERLAYKRAVKLSLQVFFGKTNGEAGTLVNEWWERMGTGEAFRTALFLHIEPINTAAALAHAERAPAIAELGERYTEIIARSMPKSRMHRTKVTAKRSLVAAVA